MKFLVYALSVGALIGSYYSIAAGITYADIACALLLIISSYKFITHQWLTDRFFISKLCHAHILATPAPPEIPHGS